LGAGGKKKEKNRPLRTNVHLPLIAKCFERLKKGQFMALGLDKSTYHLKTVYVHPKSGRIPAGIRDPGKITKQWNEQAEHRGKVEVE
jgi:hypothetical protein